MFKAEQIIFLKKSGKIKLPSIILQGFGNTGQLVGKIAGWIINK